MLIPNVEECIVVDSKVLEYLLSFIHPDGRGKAAFFTRLGYSSEDWRTLAADLKFHAAHNPVVNTVESEYGTKYVVEGPLVSPNSVKVVLRSIWFLDGVDRTMRPRLVTAYPIKELRHDF